MEITEIKDNGEFTVLVETTTEPIERTYNIDFLRKQKIEIVKSMDDFISKRNKELDEINTLIEIYENNK
jgi:hypothetical protein